MRNKNSIPEAMRMFGFCGPILIACLILFASNWQTGIKRNVIDLVIVVTVSLGFYYLGKTGNRRSSLLAVNKVFKAFPLPLMIIEKKKIRGVNASFESYFGFKRRDLVYLEQFFIQTFNNEKYREEVKGLWTRSLWKALNTSSPIQPLEVEMMCANGEVKKMLLATTHLDASEQEAYLIAFHDVTTQARMVEALNESHAVLKAIIETIPMRVFWKATDLTYLGCNTVFAKDAGRSAPSEMVGGNDFEMLWREEAESYRKDDLEVIQSQRPKLGYEELQTNADGTKKWLKTYKLPLVTENGSMLGVLGLYEDITESKRIDDELWLTKASLELCGMPFFRLSSAGEVIYVNDAACDSLGYTRQELIGKHPWDYDPDFKSEAWPELWNRLQKHEIVHLETRHRRKDGNIFDVEVTGNYISYKDEEFSFVFVQDISARKAAEEALRKKESYLRALVDNFPFMVWLKDKESRFLTVNKVHANSYDYQLPEDLVGKTDFDLSPYDLAQHYRDDDLKIMASRKREIIEEQHEGKHGRHWIETFKAPVIDGSGELLGTVGFARDITERKAVEAELAISASVFEAQEGMVVTDCDSVILKINETFTRVTGYSPEEAVGQKMSMLSSGVHDKNFYEKMWNSIVNNGSWQGEIWNRKKSGEIYPEWLTVTAIKGKDGMVSHYVGTMLDITMRKAMEDQVQYLAHHDALTDLPNRTLFNDRLHLALAQAKRENYLMCLMFLDLDRFKPVNDNLGHEVGDQLLKLVARRIAECIKRESDTVARLGGDEFVILLPRIEKQGDALMVASAIHHALENEFVIDTHSIFISSSIGIAIYPSDGTDEIDLMKNADSAMYAAKKAGKGCYRLYGQ
ncbi:uncharacterized protein NMK_1142 [Novimethylophilus kurashikiensis]|uniref:Diguanylate cyclase n=1 Tax=Novimethylophilus kurashikiensis TaxID=1825523 RepID=A0A2R5FA72_9PROT|nr:PAS domain S-box protein [Novimethylophilus kurashikiensis]GBG13591.1 uncharacterized protein NMK_1142 [Novimethylophilus kurashikiensis]